MTRRRRWAAGAASLLALLVLAACSDDGPKVPVPRNSVPTKLDGTLFFLGPGAQQGGIWSLINGSLKREVRDISDAFRQTATVAPDGTRYAWVDGGQVRVAAFDGEPAAVGPTTVEPSFAPQWSADSTRLLVRYDGTAFGWLDPATGEVAPLPVTAEPYLAFSVNDATYAVSGDLVQGSYDIFAVGSQAERSPVIPPPFRLFTRFQSIAPDGRHLIALLRGFTETRGDGDRTLAANAIVDTATGSSLLIPGGGALRQGFFRADGAAVLRVAEGLADRVLLISPDGEVADRVGLPGAVANLSLLGYTPATEPSTPEPSPTPSPTPTPPPGPAPLGGTLYLIGGDGESGGLHTLRDGILTHAVPDASADFFATVSIAPSGTRYAWISAGELRIQGLGESPATIGPPTVDASFVPAWSADGTSVIVNYDTTLFGRIDVATGVTTPLDTLAEHYFAFAPDGTYAIWGSRTGVERSVVRVGSAQPPVPVLAPAPAQIIRFQSLAPDGRHAVVLLATPDEPGVGPGRVLAANAILDLATGTVVPVPTGELRQGFFLADGSLVLRVAADGVDRVLLLSAAGEVQASTDLPPQAASLALLSYAPEAAAPPSAS